MAWSTNCKGPSSWKSSVRIPEVAPWDHVASVLKPISVHRHLKFQAQPWTSTGLDPCLHHKSTSSCPHCSRLTSFLIILSNFLLPAFHRAASSTWNSSPLPLHSCSVSCFQLRHHLLLGAHLTNPSHVWVALLPLPHPLMGSWISRWILFD